MDGMKTAVTVLQELMTKLGEQPKFEYTGQSGPAHMSVFECTCSARGEAARAAGRSKREAKQEAARQMLAVLSARGVVVPPPYCAAADPVPRVPVSDTTAPAITASASVSASPPPPAAAALPARSAVVLLKELCEEYHIAAPVYELTGDTGPAHLRHFTMRARVAAVTRDATCTTKKQARQLAAQALYSYLRERLARHTDSFMEMLLLSGNEEVSQNIDSKESVADKKRELSPSQPPASSAPSPSNKRVKTEMSTQEEEALSRAHEKVMERYVEMKEGAGAGAGAGAGRPNLGQQIADYHLEPELQQEARSVLGAGAGVRPDEEGAEALLEATCKAMNITLEWNTLGPRVHVVSMSTPAPELAQGGVSRAAAAAAALRALALALRPRPALRPDTTTA